MKTLGDHLRKRRLDLGLFQRDVAAQIGVTEASIWNWEQRRGLPELRYLPRILQFVGHDPRPAPKTLAERLVWFREGKGWSQKRMAKALGVDVTTVARWERGERTPSGIRAQMVEELLG